MSMSLGNQFLCDQKLANKQIQFLSLILFDIDPCSLVETKSTGSTIHRYYITNGLTSSSTGMISPAGSSPSRIISTASWKR